MSQAYDWIAPELNRLERVGWYRTPQISQSPPGPVIQFNGQSLVNFGSNDYLGLAGHPKLIEAAVNATQAWGVGSTGSRLLSGHRQLHQDLEIALAQFKQTEAALVFSSGYLANLGVVAALVSSQDLVIADAYNHASLKSGAKLSGAKVYEFAHGNLEQAQELLSQHRPHYRRCLILSDSVFSMDGDLCDLPKLLGLAAGFGAMVLIDEAHATGVLGPTGRGSVEHFACQEQPLIQVGTLSKALGSLGGYIVGSQRLVDYLRNRARSWIYTTGLSPADTAAALAALHLIQAEPEHHHKLWQNRNLLAQLLAELPPSFPLKLLPSESAILCLQGETIPAVQAMSQILHQAGYWVPAIRPPTVPRSRLRLSLMASHRPAQIIGLVEALQAWTV
ncbi:8-amino-7-oxononanoate synthase [Thermosynechococcaceae cyanobacterium BACA0444]|uniref:8-amino-7-ketopelargonate synthase n=1 Tax=Pseudocalidococcus azoricus BACA0444 TaxID=2918990 RepID=A0AAE4JYS4_9CYAN|nr:8-amino-7-oxononanoate synthase [Pseudocalidococcus azoricus]MDS3861299.1 8-amino-7-oxononanoate synthase [Pseudocalidococcus azoricus BACA0444]